MVEEEKRGVRRVNRPRWEGGNKRYVAKLLKRKNWFKRGNKEKLSEGNSRGESTNKWTGVEKGVGEEDLEPETVVFIPSTPRGELLKMLKETDRDFRRGTTIPPIKFIERAGTSLTDTLVSGNPWGTRNVGGRSVSCVGGKREE